jgi:hypothetical protein
MASVKCDQPAGAELRPLQGRPAGDR